MPAQALQLLVGDEGVCRSRAGAVPEHDQPAVVADQDLGRRLRVLADRFYRARVHFEVFWAAGNVHVGINFIL